MQSATTQGCRSSRHRHRHLLQNRERQLFAQAGASSRLGCFDSDEKKLLTLWLADQIKEITEQEKDIANDAMEIVKMR